jgi:hypothetical protein
MAISPSTSRTAIGSVPAMVLRKLVGRHGLDPVRSAGGGREVAQVGGHDDVRLDVDGEGEHVTILLVDRHRGGESRSKRGERIGQCGVHPIDAVVDGLR